jgi:UPF0176 protein
LHFKSTTLQVVNFFKMKLYNKINRKELKAQLQASDEPRTTISFYKYHHIGNTAIFRDHFYAMLMPLGVFGRIYVAHEGINAQISVPTTALEQLKTTLEDITFLRGNRLNIAVEQGKSFFTLTVRIRPKIVADGLDDSTFNPADTGVHLDAASFNDLTTQENTILVDMRNHYESEVGYFKNAIRPQVETFREELDLVEEMLKGNEDKNLVMYCTGGIRCEKASAYFKHKGFKNVYQLEGGIIKYANDVKEANIENRFIGKNFVFDERLGERISEDVVAQCHQCGTPCDAHTNCANDACHLLFIQCEKCATKFELCCSKECQDFIQLPDSEQVVRRKIKNFNGTRFGKGRYALTKEKEFLK